MITSNKLPKGDKTIMYKAEFLTYDDFETEEDKQDYKFLSDGFRGERTLLRITHNDKVIQEEFDGGEPEDNFFFRDWHWVASALEKAYNLGYSDRNDENELYYDLPKDKPNGYP